jgi:outer membrane protein TolC
VTRTIPSKAYPLGLVVLLLPALAVAAPPLTVQEAIRAAWDSNPALHAASASAEGAREDARRAAASRLPSIALTAKGARTDEPMMAFGIKLDQGRIGAPDFDPARLNDPAALGAWGAGAAIQVPLFMGGRLLAGQHAAEAMAGAEAADLSRRRMEVAAAVVEAYFASQAAEQGVQYAEDVVAHATETERLVRARSEQGLALDADLARATAFRAQAEAERAAARQRRASARSGLALLAGPVAGDAELSTSMAVAVGAAAPAAPSQVERPDLTAARLRAEAAAAAGDAARGALLPALFAQAAVETLRTADLAHGHAWTTLGIVARWDLSLGDAAALRAARARAQAASLALEWRRREASRDEAEASSAIATADARVRAAEEAVTASLSARALRDARHRQGLLPLTDVLDAAAGLAGARALLLSSRLEARVARARLALATHQPIEALLP